MTTRKVFGDYLQSSHKTRWKFLFYFVPSFTILPPVRGNSKNRSSKLLICSPPIGAPVSPGPVLASLEKRLLNIFFLLYKELILAFETMFHYLPSSEESSHDLGVK